MLNKRKLPNFLSVPTVYVNCSLTVSVPQNRSTCCTYAHIWRIFCFVIFFPLIVTSPRYWKCFCIHHSWHWLKAGSNKKWKFWNRKKGTFNQISVVFEAFLVSFYDSDSFLEKGMLQKKTFASIPRTSLPLFQNFFFLQKMGNRKLWLNPTDIKNEGGQ